MEETDEQLLEKVRGGDVEAFGVLYERHATDLFRSLYPWLHDSKLVEDVIDETFMKIWKNLQKKK